MLYSGLSLAVLVVLTAVAYSTRQPPPPAIAEFAPNAIEQIEEAPEEQASNVGDGNGACPAGQPNCAGLSPTPTPSLGVKPPPIDVPRVRRCVGDPPRQIEDPQSPPCVPYWQGDNGGATYKGVTATEIRIASPNYDENTNELIWAFFNKRFEFYGRKVRLIQIPENEGCSPQQQRATAAAADEDHRVFASEYDDLCDSSVYNRELARRKLVSVMGIPALDEDFMAGFTPYMWQYQMSVDKTFTNLGDWACGRLAGRPAEHAGDAQYQARMRKFGVIVDRENAERGASAGDTAPLHAALRGCGIAARQIEYRSGSEASVILDMKTSGVTSIICPCYIDTLRLLGVTATAQRYFPEWILGASTYGDTNGYIRSLGPPPEQRRNLFGLTTEPRQQRIDNTPVVWAMHEVDPNWAYKGSWPLSWLNVQYRSALLLASGIQMAGPNLTPETFAAGLRRVMFPNPDHPIMAGRVGFDEGDHSMTNDAAEWWWSDTARSPYSDEGFGTICYVDGGARQASPNWSKQPDELFKGPCDSGA